MKKKALLSSILTIALCLSLIAGSTFALFTSESKVNVAVTAGNVDVVATVENLELKSTLAKGNLAETTVNTNNNVVSLNNIVPGDYVTFDIRIHNNSNVSVQYRTVIEKIEDNGLWNGLVVTIGGIDRSNTNTVKSEWADMAVGCDDIIVSVKIALPEDRGNEYKLTSCKFAYTVEAVQGNAEVTSEWDGVSTTPVAKAEDGLYHVSTAAELVWLMNNSQSGSSAYYNQEIVLDANIDLGGATVPGFGNEVCIFGGSFDGQNHTISNFVIDRAPATPDTTYYAGLFNYYSYGTLENLTVKNATVIGDQMTGALLGCIDNGAKVNNCNVEDCTVIGYRKVGGAIGYAQDATVENCAVKDTTVYCAVTAQSHGNDQWGEVIGYKNTGLVEGTNTSDNVTVLTGATAVADGVVKQGSTYLIYSADGLNWFNDQINNHRNSFTFCTVKLTADIDMKGAAWLPAGQNFTYDYAELGYADTVQFCGTFDGNGKTISNIKITGLNKDQANSLNNTDATRGATDHNIYSVGFFGYTTGTVKNLTIENAEVRGYHYVGTIVGYADVTSYIENCHVKNATISCTHISAEQCGDKAGGIVGALNNTTTGADIKDCSVERTSIIAGRDAGYVIGCAFPEAGVENCTASYVTVGRDTHCTDDDAGHNITSGIIGRDLR